jgi:hypothetical protein
MVTWHGTNLDAIEGILSRGFVVTPTPSNGRAYGHGLYLAPETGIVTSLGFARPDASGGGRGIGASWRGGGHGGTGLSVMVVAGICHVLLCHLFCRKLEKANLAVGSC